MPFLRAALLKKKLQLETERVKAVLTPVAEEEQEPEEELTPVQIEDLHRLIDTRTREAEYTEPEFSRAETVVLVVPEFVPEPESVLEVFPEADSLPELEITPEETITLDADSVSELETLQEEITQPEADSLSETEAEQEEIVTPETESLPETETSQEETTTSEADSLPETETLQEEIVTPEAESLTETEALQEEISTSEAESLPETETLQEEIVTPEADTIPETETLQEETSTTDNDFDENDLLTETDTESESEIQPTETETESDNEPETSTTSTKDYSGSHLDYDFTSGERYVDKVSTKTEFDKMLDELSAISKELLSWQTEKFARDYTEKFSEGESSQAEARKYEAFLGGYITNAAMMLYDKGYRDAAIKQLEQAISILQARKKLEDETSAIKSRVEEQNDAVDLSDILGLFGDG